MKELIIKLKEKTGMPDFSMRSFEGMAEELTQKMKQPFDAKYLKYTVYEGKTTSKIRETRLDVIAEFLGYKNYRDFLEINSLDPLLESMIGDYYCYVRMNMQKGRLLRSPVKIFMENGRIAYRLKGGRLNYEGELKMKGQCLFVLMQSGNKSFYHVYRMGEEPSPQALQGVFSGVSSDFKPIGGRALLIRTENSFESLTNDKIDVEAMAKSKLPDEQELATYFKDKTKNNLTLNNTATSRIRDLNES